MSIPDDLYLTAVKALLAIKPEHTHISDTFALSAVCEVVDPEFFRAALNVAYEAGKTIGAEAQRADMEEEWSARYVSDGGPFVGGTYTRGGAERYADAAPGLGVFRRLVTEWEQVAR